MATSKLQLPGGLRLVNGLPDIAKYWNINDTPYTSTAQVLSEITLGIRHTGLKVQVLTQEYWWPTTGGVTDGELVVYSVGGGTITGGANGLSTSGANIILGGSVLTTNVVLDGTGTNPNFTISNVGVINISNLGASTYTAGTNMHVQGFGETKFGSSSQSQIISDNLGLHSTFGGSRSDMLSTNNNMRFESGTYYSTMSTTADTGAAYAIGKIESSDGVSTISGISVNRNNTNSYSSSYDYVTSSNVSISQSSVTIQSLNATNISSLSFGTNVTTLTVNYSLHPGLRVVGVNEANYTAETLISKNYHNTHIGNKAVDTLVTTPTVTEHGKVIAWNNTNSEYELITVGGGGGTITGADNGLNVASNIVKLGGALLATTNITGAFTLSLGTNASKLSNLKGYATTDIGFTSLGSSWFESDGRVDLTSYTNDVKINSFLGNVNIAAGAGVNSLTLTNSGTHLDMTATTIDLYSNTGDVDIRTIAGSLNLAASTSFKLNGVAAGTPSTMFFRGDGTWAIPAGGGGGSGTVNSSTIGQVAVYTGATAVTGVTQLPNTNMPHVGRTITAATSIAQTDDYGVIYVNSATNISITVDTLTINSRVELLNIGAGDITFINGAGVTFTGSSTMLSGQTAVILYKGAVAPLITAGGGGGGAGTIAGSIAVDQIPIGLSADTVFGSSALTFASNKLNVKGTASSSTLTPEQNLGYAADADPALSLFAYAHDNIRIMFDSYYNGTNFISSQLNSNFSILKNNNSLTFCFASGITKGSSFSWNSTGGLNMNSTGAVGIGVTPSLGKLQLLAAPSVVSLKAGTLNLQAYGTNTSWLSDGIYHDGTNYKYSDTGFGAMLQFTGGGAYFITAPTLPAGSIASPDFQFGVGNTGIIYARTLDTDLTPPSTTGTIRVVVADSTGILSTIPVPSGSGISRSVSIISTTTTGGATALTDYVYYCSGTFTFTLPTAVGNTNRYTLVHTDTNTLTIATTGGQTIAFYPAAPATTATVTVRGTVVELFSDGANWWTI